LDTQLIVDVNGSRRFWLVAIDFDLAALDRLGRQGAGFEETGSPKPFVEPDLWMFFWHWRRVYRRATSYNNGKRTSARKRSHACRNL